MLVLGSEFEGFKMNAIIGDSEINQDFLDLRHHRRRAAEVDSGGGGLGSRRLSETPYDQIFGNVA